MTDLDRIVTELRGHGPDVWAALVEFLPRVIALIKGKRRAEIVAALDHAHSQIRAARAAADREIAERDKAIRDA